MHFHWYMLSFIFPLITLKFHVKVLHLSGNSSAGKKQANIHNYVVFVAFVAGFYQISAPVEALHSVNS